MRHECDEPITLTVRLLDRPALERVARAVHWEHSPDPSVAALSLDEDWDGWKALVPVIRTVLWEIRDPSESMIVAGAQVDEWVKTEGQSPQPQVWQAMIDAALVEDLA